MSPTASILAPATDDDAPPAREGVFANADPRRWDTHLIAEMAMALALAVVLGPVFTMVVPLRMPQGGSVSLEMLPILFVAIRRGVVPGVAVGALVRVRRAAAGVRSVHGRARFRSCSTTRSPSPPWVWPGSSRCRSSRRRRSAAGRTRTRLVSFVAAAWRGGRRRECWRASAATCSRGSSSSRSTRPRVSRSGCTR